MDKWDELKTLIYASLSHSVHYSNDKQYENNQLRRVQEWMSYLENKEKEQKECLDSKLIEETEIRGIQGLS